MDSLRLRVVCPLSTMNKPSNSNRISYNGRSHFKAGALAIIQSLIAGESNLNNR